MRYGFIGGYGRSGTTVAMLAMSKSNAVFPLMETQLFNEVVFPFLDAGMSHEQFRAAYRRFVGEPKDMEFSGQKSKKNTAAVTSYFTQNEQAALNILSAAGPYDIDRDLKVKKFTDLMFGCQASACGKDLCLEKSPRIITVAGRLARALPDAKFIHMHRDPRDVYASVKQKNWGPKNIPQFVSSYSSVMTKAYRQRHDVQSHHYMTIQMEDLVAQPGQYLRAMASFLGLTADFMDEAVSLVNEGDSNIGRWKDELSDDQATDIMAGCGDIYLKWRGMNFQP